MYNFINLQAGTYYVIQTNLATYDDVKDIDGGNPNNITVGLIGGEDKVGNDFVDERLGTISGSANEENGKAISSVQITLKNAKDIVVTTTEIDSAGDYIFREVAPSVGLSPSASPSAPPSLSTVPSGVPLATHLVSVLVLPINHLTLQVSAYRPPL